MKKLNELVKEIKDENTFINELDFTSLKFKALDCLFSWALEKYEDKKYDFHSFDSTCLRHIKELFPDMPYMTSKAIVDYLKVIQSYRILKDMCYIELSKYEYDKTVIEKLI